MPRKSGVKPRGVFERPKNSGIWWVQHFSDGVRHREKVGRKSDAIALYALRKSEARAGKKLPQNIRREGIKFQQLADDILVFSANHHSDQKHVKTRVKSRLAMAGVNLKTQILASHRTIAMTARYAHLARSSLHAAVETITGWQQPAQSLVPSATCTATSCSSSL